MPANDISLERALELAIEVGAEDVQETEDEEEKPLLQVRHVTLKIRCWLPTAVIEMGKDNKANNGQLCFPLQPSH